VYFDNPPANQVVSTGFAVIRPLKCVYPKFLKWLILSPEFIERVMIHSEGVGYPAINPSKLARLPIWIPPLSEQRAIADFLDRETGRIDALITKYRRLIELLEEKRTSLISQAVTKGLDPSVEMKDSGVEWLGKIPRHWNYSRVKHLCMVKRGASPRPIDDPIYFDENGEYSWVRISDVTSSNKYLQNTEQKLSEYGKSKCVCLEPGELFISICASVGKPIISNIKCCIHDGFVWLKNLKQNKDYYYYLFTSGEVYKGLGKTGTQLNLNTDFIGNIFVPIPSVAEQQTIVDFLDCETARIDLMKERIVSMITKLKETALRSYHRRYREN
jgi:type I restriction enzyme S subunit